MLTGIFEVGMLLCFAAAWPANIYKAYRARTTLGTSLPFMVIVEIGYVCGMLNKVVNDEVFVEGVFNYVMAFCQSSLGLDAALSGTVASVVNTLLAVIVSFPVLKLWIAPSK